MIVFALLSGVLLYRKITVCSHRNLTRPFTLKLVDSPSAEPRTYKVCRDCGARLPYATNTMSLIKKGQFSKLGTDTQIRYAPIDKSGLSVGVPVAVIESVRPVSQNMRIISSVRANRSN